MLDVYNNLFSTIFKKVYTAINGKDGLEVFKKEPIDIILTDQSMPIYTGLKMIRDIRKIDASIPIILVTALENVDVLKEALELHVTSFMSKPFTEQKLKEVFNIAVKSVIADRIIQKEQSFTIKNLTKSVNYNAYQEKLSFEKEKIIAQNDIEDSSKIGEYTCKVHYEPLDILSGDSYVIREVNDNETFIFLVDGMGKGISASLSAMLSSASVNYYIDNVQKKDEVFDFDGFLGYIFDFIQPTLLEDEAISAHFILLNKKDNELYYSIFSMPPIICCTQDKDLIKIKSNNIPFSKYGKSFRVDSISLDGVEKILLHSDGLNENSVKNNDLTYGQYLEDDFILSDSKESFQDRIDSKIGQAEDDMTYIYLKKD
jgi:CheY-like chemotaxis protein